MSDVIKPSEDFQYYVESSIYWNDFDTVVSMMNRKVSGHDDVNWVRHVKTTLGYRAKALFVSCGNGWVERACFGEGLIGQALGFDVMPNLLDIARVEAQKIAMPADYFYADGNNLTPPLTTFDLIVNNGSIHHIANLDRLLRQIRTLISPGGSYVINDYTGPHRNQYSWDAWARMLELNAALPKRFKIEMQYPHMPTMLHVDPTEAIHSELAMDVTARYFDFPQRVQLGGGIAYTLLYGNRALFEERDSTVGRAALDLILTEDAHFTARHPESNLFTFAICTPKASLPSDEVLDRWTLEEDTREAAARGNNGRYYPPTPLELIYNEMSDVKYANRILNQNRAS